MSFAGGGSLACQKLAKPPGPNAQIYSQSYFDHIGRDESNTTIPLLRGVVKHVVHPELVIFLRQSIQVLPQQNILRIDIGKDKIDLRGIVSSRPRPSPDDGTNDLEHGRNTGSAGNHAEMAHHIRGVHHGALGALDLHRLPDHERGDVLADVAGGIRLDQEIEVALLLIGRYRSVGSHDFLGLPGDGGG